MERVVLVSCHLETDKRDHFGIYNSFPSIVAFNAIGKGLEQELLSLEIKNLSEKHILSRIDSIFDMSQSENMRRDANRAAIEHRFAPKVMNQDIETRSCTYMELRHPGCRVDGSRVKYDCAIQPRNEKSWGSHWGVQSSADLVIE